MLQPRIYLLRSTTNSSHHTLTRTYASLTTSKPQSSSQLPPSLLKASYNLPTPPSPDLFGPKAPDEGLKKYKPRTPGLRHVRALVNPHLWKGSPYKPLTFPKKGHSRAGRNNTGRITVRHRGGGHKRRIRTLDFKRVEAGPHLVERIEYDPGRSAHIALLTNKANGEKSYIVAAAGMRAGDIVQSYRAGIPDELMAEMGGKIDPGLLAARICVRGNCLPTRLVPPGTQVYCIGSAPQRGAVFARSAGTFGTVLGRDEAGGVDAKGNIKFMIVKLSSGETRKVSGDACATIGVASNAMWQFRQLGKAGRSRWLGIRPTVRGVAMNACELHGHQSEYRLLTNVQAKSGFKTRNKQNPNTWIVEERYRNFGRRRKTK